MFHSWEGKGTLNDCLSTASNRHVTYADIGGLGKWQILATRSFKRSLMLSFRRLLVASTTFTLLKMEQRESPTTHLDSLHEKNSLKGGNGTRYTKELWFKLTIWIDAPHSSIGWLLSMVQHGVTCQVSCSKPAPVHCTQAPSEWRRPPPLRSKLSMTVFVSHVSPVSRVSCRLPKSLEVCIFWLTHPWWHATVLQGSRHLGSWSAC